MSIDNSSIPYTIDYYKEEFLESASKIGKRFWIKELINIFHFFCVKNYPIFEYILHPSLYFPYTFSLYFHHKNYLLSFFVGFNWDASIPTYTYKITKQLRIIHLPYTYKITRQLRIIHSPYDLFVFIQFLKYSSNDRISVVVLKQKIK